MIIASALKLPSGAIASLPRPARHHDVIKALSEDGFGASEIAAAEQGFLTSEGTFAHRRLARRIAFHSGQVATEGGEIFSEDIW